MILSPGRGYAFVHAPKTGGTAMALALEAHAMADDILIGDTPKALKRRGRLNGAQAAGRLWKHSTLRDVRGLLPDPVLDRLTPVMLVRNPWDRMVSYYHWLRAQDFDNPAVTRAKTLGFKAFVLDPKTGESFRRNPSASYVAGGALPIFIRLEHLETDLVPFTDLLGFGLILPRVNSSDRLADWRSYYDATTRDCVAEICAADISAFSYHFEPTNRA
ncbi:Sulfotransferase family protein [Jannaschia faecimaris]|uniref:Sulfotransferase family protein n=1 Tax=Jannaschia faecimaris TaxID=1244108 RepID=A0A1H3NQX5_9RHOB|nr:sulfotransferase family 2 domain-containing protein [Jannaschia faecimaris]SDY91234.1 Sulfotransferase family protein [Jannaschia faecimaris]